MYQRHLTFKLLSSTPDETVSWILLSWAAADWMHCWKDDGTTKCVDYAGSVGWCRALNSRNINPSKLKPHLLQIHASTFIPFLLLLVLLTGRLRAATTGHARCTMNFAVKAMNSVSAIRQKSLSRLSSDLERNDSWHHEVMNKDRPHTLQSCAVTLNSCRQRLHSYLIVCFIYVY